MHDEIVLQTKNLSKQYDNMNAPVLSEVSFSIEKGEFAALLGPSGSGKSTLLHMIGLLDTPTSGEVIIEGKIAQKLSENAKTKIRLKKIGFVYQYHHLLQEFSALENVMMPQIIAGVEKKTAQAKSLNLLEELALADKAKSLPSELSGGQKQRVAIARALANDPIILLADEPTGNLDHETAMLVFNDLLKMMHNYKMSAIIATHNLELLEGMSSMYFISEGRLFKK